MTSRRLYLFLFCAAPVLMSGSAVTFTDQSEFLSAAQQIPNSTVELDTFNGPGLTAPGLRFQDYSDWISGGPISVSTIDNGVFNGCVGHFCGSHLDDVTTWYFSNPTYAFGATFTYPGKQIDAIENGISAFGITEFPYQDGFFGFVSDTPFTQFMFIANDSVINPFEHTTQFYTMDNLYFAERRSTASAPEPSTTGLVFAVFALMGVCVRTRKWLDSQPGPAGRKIPHGLT